MTKSKDDKTSDKVVNTNDFGNKEENPDFIAIRCLKQYLAESKFPCSCIDLLYYADLIKDNLEPKLNQIKPPRFCYRLYVIPNLDNNTMTLFLYSTRPQFRKIIEGIVLFAPDGIARLATEESTYDFFKRVLPQYKWPEKKLRDFEKYCHDKKNLDTNALTEADCDDVIAAYNEFHEKRTKKKKSN